MSMEASEGVRTWEWQIAGGRWECVMVGMMWEGRSDLSECWA